jgi:hypothetical protein
MKDWVWMNIAYTVGLQFRWQWHVFDSEPSEELNIGSDWDKVIAQVQAQPYQAHRWPWTTFTTHR